MPNCTVRKTFTHSPGRMEVRNFPGSIHPRAGQILATLSLLVASGCGTPAAVRKLSSEQVRVSASFEQTLKGYFDIIDRLTANQLAVSNATIDETTKQIIDLRKRQANNAIKAAADDIGRQKAIDDLTSAITSEADTAAKDKAQIAELVAKLKIKHREMLAAFSVIKAAQEKLDTYIQLKKADETALDELLNAVGVSRETLNRDATDISSIADQVTALIQPPKGKSP